eukprot:TRINITY_DN16952_c0_g1_i1.p1 TRINITY_DN16952_c0_g1~~TRINITY_DN16952_c0_g1_i1.p1  ORF type:complete len:356 (-),score=74.93 TRINITY_DN16952_c0_g1_i1:543-1610(-)
MATGEVRDLRSKAELEEAVHSGGTVVLHFWASWCEASKHLDVVFAQLASDTPHATFFRVEAEEQVEISEAYQVKAVPFFLFFKDTKVAEKLEGANPSGLANTVAKLAGPPPNGAAHASHGLAGGAVVLGATADLAKPNGHDHAAESDLKDRVKELIHSHSVMLFMKGTPEEPRCGFSKKVVNTLKEEDIKFGSFDILSDRDVREGLKMYSNWPTYPQLYHNGELLGGCDIILEMHQSGELKEVLATANQQEEEEETMDSRLAKLIKSHKNMLFMKGTPEEPRCGFSKKVANMLKDAGVPFGSFDILSDREVREALKLYSNWPTYPQLYHNGELVGGCDILVEMKQNGELEELKSD